MNKFDRFAELFDDPKWYPEEYGKAFLWYHVRALRDKSGEKTADIATILEYYKCAPKNPPPVDSLEKFFRNQNNGVEVIGNRYFIPPKQARWYEDNYGEKVFGSDLADFVVGSDQHPASQIPPVHSEAELPVRDDFWKKLLHFGKDPAAWWIGVLLTVVGIVAKCMGG